MSSTDPSPATPKPRGRHPGNRHAARYPEPTRQITLRLPLSLHARLEQSAAAAARPLSQQIVSILASSCPPPCG